MTQPEFMNYLEDQKDFITSSPGGSTYVADANLGSQGAIFSGRLSYAKGGYILRMLKWVLGDTAFYQAIKEYHSRPNLAYNYAKTADLAASLLQSTGKDFTGFFNDWVYGEGYPTYDIRWRASSNQTITIKVGQTQSNSSVSFYEMPLPIKVNGTAGQVAYLTLNNISNNQYFVEPVPFPIANIQFNYEYQVLEKNSTVTKDLTLSVQDVTKDQFALYPNPVKNELYLKGMDKSKDFKIYSAEGRLIKTGIYQLNKSINVSELIPGVYVFKIEDRNIKFVKE
jgi:aminopeptidase N